MFIGDKMIIYVDIDDTICTGGTKDDYNLAKPLLQNIDKINKLHDEGNLVIYWTARGTATQHDWFRDTFQQLKRWGCRFTELKMGKPSYDLFIDDKAIEAGVFFNEDNSHYSI